MGGGGGGAGKPTPEIPPNPLQSEEEKANRYNTLNAISVRHGKPRSKGRLLPTDKKIVGDLGRSIRYMGANQQRFANLSKNRHRDFTVSSPEFGCRMLKCNLAKCWVGGPPNKHMSAIHSLRHVLKFRKIKNQPVDERGAASVLIFFDAVRPIRLGRYESRVRKGLLGCPNPAEKSARILAY